MPQPTPEDIVKTGLWTCLQDCLASRREMLTDAQVYRLLTDFAEAHKPQ